MHLYGGRAHVPICQYIKYFFLDSNVIYVTYQDQDSNEIPALVQILNEDSDGSNLNAAQTLSQTDESIVNTLLPSAEQASELRLEDFDEDAALPMSASQLHVNIASFVTDQKNK